MSKSSKKRLVVVDDDIGLREELAAFFGDSFDVDTFAGTSAALEALRDAPPDALLLDIDLQDIKGFDVLRLMTSTPDLRSVPVIVLSADQRLRDLRAGSPAGHRRVRHQAVPGRETCATSSRRRSTVATGAAPGASSWAPCSSRAASSRQPQIDHALQQQQHGGGRLGEVLVGSGLVSEDDLINALAGQMHLAVVDLRTVTPNPAAVGLLPRDFIVRHRLLPLRIDDDGSLVSP